MLAWNIIEHLAIVDVIKVYQSLVESSINTIFSVNESFGVIVLALNFLGKVLEVYEL